MNWKGRRALRIRDVCLERSVARTLYFVGQQMGRMGGSQTLNQAKDDMFMAGTKDYLADEPQHKTQ